MTALTLLKRFILLETRCEGVQVLYDRQYALIVSLSLTLVFFSSSSFYCHFNHCRMKLFFLLCAIIPPPIQWEIGLMRENLCVADGENSHHQKSIVVSTFVFFFVCCCPIQCVRHSFYSINSSLSLSLTLEISEDLIKS